LSQNWHGLANKRERYRSPRQRRDVEQDHIGLVHLIATCSIYVRMRTPPRRIKIGARIIRHARAITCQFADVAIPRDLLPCNLEAFHRLRPSLAPT